eukprot:snap_masked-scaffold_38-processed-gene-2.60-mRNA-1 protein AED:1.00 eAED:1.00 QI:0/0/0/0/1/1/3/0/911
MIERERNAKGYTKTETRDYDIEDSTPLSISDSSERSNSGGFNSISHSVNWRKYSLFGAIFILALLLIPFSRQPSAKSQISSETSPNLRKFKTESGFIQVSWSDDYYDRASRNFHADDSQILLFTFQESFLERLFLISAVSSSSLVNEGEQETMKDLERSSDESNVFKLTYEDTERDSLAFTAPNLNVEGANKEFTHSVASEMEELSLTYLAILKKSNGYISVDASKLLFHLFFVVEAAPDGSSPALISSLRLLKVRAFENNLVIRAEVTYGNSASPQVEGAISPREFLLSEQIEFNLYLLPKETSKFKPRLFSMDLRENLGFFTTNHLSLGEKNSFQNDFNFNLNRGRSTRAEVDQSRQVISRFNIKEKIIFYVDPSVPDALYETVRSAVEAWNKAFDKISSSKVVKCIIPTDKEFPKDFDPADGRFNSIVWSISKDSVFAMGTKQVDPRTGEALRAVIIIAHEWLGAWEGKYTLLQYVEVFKNSGITKEMFFEKALKFVVMHEVGHTLGLRHNFKGSLFYSTASGCKNWVLTSTVMDYLPENVPSSESFLGIGCTPGDLKHLLYSDGIGPWDEKSIEYAYGNEIEVLDGYEVVKSSFENELKSSLTAMAFGTDEQSYEVSKDAYNMPYDFTDEPVSYYEDLLKRIREVRTNKNQDKLTELESGIIEQQLLGELGAVIQGATAFLGGYDYGVNSVKLVDYDTQVKAVDLLVEILAETTSDIFPSGVDGLVVKTGMCEKWRLMQYCEGERVVNVDFVVFRYKAYLLSALFSLDKFRAITEFEGVTGTQLIGYIFTKTVEALFGTFTLASETQQTQYVGLDPKFKDQSLWDLQLEFVGIMKKNAASLLFEVEGSPEEPTEVYIGEKVSALQTFYTYSLLQSITGLEQKIDFSSCCSPQELGHLLNVIGIASSE